MAQKLEHYESSAYGKAQVIANEVGYSKVVDLLRQTGDEESEIDEKLTDLADRLMSEVVEPAAQRP